MTTAKYVDPRRGLQSPHEEEDFGTPGYLVRLREQAAQIERERKRAARERQHQAEADSLRRQIRAAGRKPVCQVAFR